MSRPDSRWPENTQAKTRPTKASTNEPVFPIDRTSSKTDSHFCEHFHLRLPPGNHLFPTPLPLQLATCSHQSSGKSSMKSGRPKPNATPGAITLNAKRPAEMRAFSIEIIPWQRLIFPHLRGCSIVGAMAFHFRVRDGNGWDHHALTTRRNILNRRMMR